LVQRLGTEANFGKIVVVADQFGAVWFPRSVHRPAAWPAWKSLMGSVYIDLTTLSSWRGQPVGISRCQQEYARFALNNIPNVRFTLFDPAKTATLPPENRVCTADH
jgi:hypothetical protein